MAVRTRTFNAAPEWAVYLAGALPALALAFALSADGLGADPAKALERELGEWALRFLLAGLAITPLWRLTGLNLSKYRRAVGLTAFAYVSLHLATYVVLDYQFAWGQIWGDIVKRPYIMVGMAAFVLLLPLAATSNAASIRRLGAQAWKRLHWLVYAIVPLAALHFVLLTKTWQVEPLIHLGLAITLVALRHPAFDFRARPARAPKPVQAGSLAP